MDSPNPPSGGAAFGALASKLYRFRGIAKRNWWVLAITIGLGLAYQGWGLYRQPHLYESSAQINMREQVDAPGEQEKWNSYEKEAFVATTMALLKNPEILNQAEAHLAIESPNLKGPRPEIISTQVPRSYIFTITGRGLNPEYTRRFVDATVDAFIDYRDKQRDDTMTNIGHNVKAEIARQKAALDADQAKFQAFIKDNSMPFWADQLKQSTEYLSGLKTREAALQTDLQRLQNLTPDQLLNSAPMQPAPRNPAAASLAPAPTDSFDPATSLYSLYIQRMQDLSQTQSRLDERSKVWKPKHPKLQILKDQVAEIQRSIDLIKQQNRDAAAQRVDAINAELKSLATGIQTWNKRILEASSKDAEYKALQDNVQHDQAALDKLQANNELSNVAGGVDIFTKLQTATVPVEVPSEVVKHLLIGFLCGAVLGIAILYLLDRADDRLASSAEMMAQFSEPILGQIPDVVESRGESGLPLLQAEDDRYTFAEAFRSLRSSLIFMPNQGELRTILVTSAIPNEGKSTIASNLAITMAAGGASVVLIDADLRRGDLASLFDTDGRTGLSNILRGEVSWKDAAQTTKYPSLTLIPRGPVTSQSSELLLLPSVEKLLEELKGVFDLVIFNTAPILATDDTPTLSPHFDGTVMVVRARFTSARLTQNALSALYQRQVNVLGLILNCVDTDMPDYYYYRYPKYYAAN